MPKSVKIGGVPAYLAELFVKSKPAEYHSKQGIHSKCSQVKHLVITNIFRIMEHYSRYNE